MAKNKENNTMPEEKQGFVKRMFFKYKEIIMYLIFGVLTTLVGWITYFLILSIGKMTFDIQAEDTTGGTYVAIYTVAQIVQWIAAVLFAFFTNRKYVFEASKNGFLKQLFGFFSMRIATGVLDVLIMILLVDFLEFNDLLIKLLSNVLVIILNYIFSKFLVFKKKK